MVVNATGMVVACCCVWSLLCTQVFQFVQSYPRFRALHLCLFSTHTPSLLHCNTQSTFAFSNSLLVCECSGHVVYREVCVVCVRGEGKTLKTEPQHMPSTAVLYICCMLYTVCMYVHIRTLYMYCVYVRIRTLHTYVLCVCTYTHTIYVLCMYACVGCVWCCV